MKLLIFLCLVTLSLAEISSYEPQQNNNHYSQHHASISAAKGQLAQKIAKIEENTGAAGLNQVHYSSGHSASGKKLVAGCSYCTDTAYTSSGREGFDSRSSSRNSDSELSSTDYVGVGVVGHSSDVRNSRLSSASTSDDVQAVLVPVYPAIGSNSMQYSDRSYDAETLQQRQAPVTYPLIGRQSSTYSASNQEGSVNKVSEAIPVYQPSTRTFSQQRSESVNEETRNTPYVRVVPVPVVSNQHESSLQREQSTDVSGSNMYYQPSSGRYVHYVRPGSTIYHRIPVRVQSTNEQQSGLRTEQSESTGTGGQYSGYYRPAVDSTSGRGGVSGTLRTAYYPAVQQTEKHTEQENRSDLRNYGTYRVPETSAQTRYQAASSSQSQQQQRQYVAPTSVPIVGGSRYTPGQTYSTRYVPTTNTNSRNTEWEEDDNQDLTQTRIPAGSSSSYGASSRHHASSGNTYAVPIVPVVPVVPVASTRSSSQHSAHRSESSSQRLAPVNVESSDYESRARQSSSRQDTQRAYAVPTYGQRTAGSGYDSRYNSYGQREASRDNVPSTRLGTSVLNTNTDLNSYMSESERLARLQSKSISSGSSSNYAPPSNIDDINRRTLEVAENLDATSADFVNSQNTNRLSFDGLDTSNIGGTGGYKRVKSWEKQSKWASGSQYGSDGKPKSYSMLSTAESEKHNINGAEAGYKAATTTLEDDGKVSTYSIHTR